MSIARHVCPSNPVLTGSAALTNTMGIFVAAAFAALAGSVRVRERG